MSTPEPVFRSTPHLQEFLSGGGELGRRIREFDWSKTSLGPVDTWPQSLKTCIRIMLTSRQPIWIGWGKELIKLYNDPYKAIVGGKHPWALGLPASVVWKDIWRDIGPLLKNAMEKNEGSYVEAQLLIMERNGYPEETYYTFSYTPIPGEDGGPAGMICANTDDTYRIISERQLKTLTRLGKNLTSPKTNEEVIHKTMTTLKNNPHDFPFALFYLMQDNKAVLSDTGGPNGTGAMPLEIALDEEHELAVLLRKAAASRKLQLLEGLQEKFGEMPKGAWETAPAKAIILPVLQPGTSEPYGFLIIGHNPYRLLDENYSGFFTLVADQVATSFSNAHALEEERKRAEALAEVDRAKTTFFSNISHEFRTPLTLLLGPIEEALQDPRTDPGNRSRLDLARSNGLRMQKLVNTLLDFSRIEAGRMEGKFTKVDLGALTENLASSFRSAIEKAGMELQISIAPIKGDVYVDVDMWEKIILNLISNAFKYSREGTIRVKVEQAGDQVQVTVTDNGVGIPEDQQEKIFDRFHRIENTDGRSQEGTGIGLAMVKELVKLHQGAISVSSRPGSGAAFTVSLLLGKKHLPAGKIMETYDAGPGARTMDAFAEEAAKWVPGENRPPAAGHEDNLKYAVLLADDNADMREYIYRLLGRHYAVKMVTNGLEAFNTAVDYMPDLIISDIMMPELDGFGLLKKLKGDSRTHSIPVIFLSARAGEEAKVEGLQAGVDDYLVKPFSAKELLARVEANIKIARQRMAGERKYRQLIYGLPAAVYTCNTAGYIDLFNDAAVQLWGRYPEIGKDRYCGSYQAYTPQGHPVPPEESAMARALTDGEIISAEVVIERQDGSKRHVMPHPRPIYDARGNITGAVNILVDITDQKRFSEKLELTVRQRTEELQRSNDDLLQFAHVVSHDLKEPVRKIKTFGKRLQDDFGEAIPEKGKTYLSKVLGSTDRMFAVIDGVLSYSALNASEEPVTLIDLNEVFRNVEADLEVLIQQKNATIVYNELPKIEGAPVLIYQLFYNIVQNSLKFSKPDLPPQITITAAVVAKGPGVSWMEMTITDNGIGFEEQYAKSIFNTFARLHSKEKFEGTGLGLALCKKIVERHQGAISATGVRDKGAQFKISLPLKTTVSL
jgi:PAS domain S-box-containing protein